MTILKKSSYRAFCAILALSFYGFGSFCWWLTITHAHRGELFYLAAVLFVAAFICSLRWSWRNKFIHRQQKRYSRRYSDTQPNSHSDAIEQVHEQSKSERRVHTPRTNKKLRFVAVTCSSLLFAAVNVELYNSYESHVLRGRDPEVAVFVGVDRSRMKALSVPFIGTTAPAKEMDFAMLGVPTQEAPVPAGASSITVNVILRNVSNFDIVAPRVKIDSNLPIASPSMTFASVTDTEVGSDLPVLHPFKQPEDEERFDIQIPVRDNGAWAGLLVSMAGDNMHAYAAAIKILPLQQR